MAQRRTIKMHPKLLMDTIRRQAGTLQKAMLEGAMNAVDAKATKYDIILERDKLVIQDDGQGFRSEEEIEQWFDTFGTPHDESENKIYAAFRMGRGQLFSFGPNVWRSGKFRMEVDIEKDGLDYTLRRMKKSAKGCRIEVTLKDKLTLLDLDDVLCGIRKLVKWQGLHDVIGTLNGVQITQDPRTQKKDFWQYENVRCWMHVGGTGGMAIYNLGSHVKDYHSYEYGVSGEAVSKQQLKVNFARNDIMSSCPVFKDIKAFMAKSAGQEIRKKPSLNDASRQRVATMMRNGTMPEQEAMGYRVFTDVTGRHRNLRDLGYKSYDYPKYTVTNKGSRIGDKLHQARVAFVFASETLTRFRVEHGDELMALMQRWHCPAAFDWTYVPFSEISAGFKADLTLVDPKQYTAKERVVIDLAERLTGWFVRELGGYKNSRDRRLVIGKGMAAGWTDGASYIAIEREWLKDRDFGVIQGAVEIGNLLLHEFCHGSPDWDSHVHDAEFYQRFHDASGAVAAFAHEWIGKLPVALKAMKRKLTKKQLTQQSRVMEAAELSDETEKLAALVRK